MYGSTAARVRESKEKHPEQFCSDTRCLWRVVTRDGVKPCPKHPQHSGSMINSLVDTVDAVRSKS